MEKVLARDRKFGLLSKFLVLTLKANCDHAFCLECIRNWRGQYSKKKNKSYFRLCPLCRTESYVIIPSNQFIESGDEKDEIMYRYKTILQNMPCKHFNKGEGKCPFLNSCFYAHQLKYSLWIYLIGMARTMSTRFKLGA